MGFCLLCIQGDTRLLLDDIAELKPTVFCAVPRLFNRIYDKVLAGVKAKGGVSSYLFFKAYNAKKAHLDQTVHHWLWDSLVFGQVISSLNTDHSCPDSLMIRSVQNLVGGSDLSSAAQHLYPLKWWTSCASASRLMSTKGTGRRKTFVRGAWPSPTITQLVSLACHSLALKSNL